MLWCFRILFAGGEGAAVHNGFYIFNTRSFKAGCLLFGATTLCMILQPWVKLGLLRGLGVGCREFGGSPTSPPSREIGKKGLTMDSTDAKKD